MSYISFYCLLQVAQKTTGQGQQEVDTTADRVTDAVLFQRILCCKGPYAVARLISKSFAPSIRPDTDIIRQKFKALEEKGIGKLAHHGRVEGFLKPATLTEEQCGEVSISSEHYSLNYSKMNQQISESHRSILSRLHGEFLNK